MSGKTWHAMEVGAAQEEAQLGAELAANDDDQGLLRGAEGDRGGAADGTFEVRVDEEMRDPDYGSGEALERDGATSASAEPEDSLNQLGSSAPLSGRQRPVPVALDDGVVREPGTTEGLVEAQPQALSQSRPASRERRTEDVGQVARSLAYMTSLVTTLVGRMDRVEQAQSRNGSSASGRRTTTATSARMDAYGRNAGSWNCRMGRSEQLGRKDVSVDCDGAGKGWAERKTAGDDGQHHGGHLQLR